MLLWSVRLAIPNARRLKTILKLPCVPVCMACGMKCRPNQSNVVPLSFRYYKRSAACVSSGRSVFFMFSCSKHLKSTTDGERDHARKFFLRGSGSVFCLLISQHIWQGQKSITELHNLQKGTDGRSRAKNL